MVLALAVALAVTGCKKPGSAKLEGHWRGTRADGVGPGQQDAANAFALGTEITARGEKLTISTPGAKGVVSSYVVDDENKTTVVVHTEKDGPNMKETFEFQDAKTMTWRLGGGPTITFTKLKD